MSSNSVINTKNQNLGRLQQYVASEQYKGYDPFDALNSPIFSLLSRRSKWLRILFTQLLRRLPVNIRPVLGMKPEYNPKAMGLFLSSYVNLHKMEQRDEYFERIRFFADWLAEHASSGYSGHCWGYNFDWQNREFYAPERTPTVVNTSFVGHGLLDAYELLGEQRYADIARSACEFILNDLHISRESDSICFSYTPLDTGRVHNANYLGASLLIRTGDVIGDAELKDQAEAAYNYSNSKQLENGAWRYGEEEVRGWIDGFHTGFNLEALYWHSLSPGKANYASVMEKGLKFYIENLFTSDGIPKYYHNSIYPIDIHSAAQALITLAKLRESDARALPVLKKVRQWTINNMQDPAGYFYFRKGRIITNKIPYIRWGQAWMLLALTTVQTLVPELDE